MQAKKVDDLWLTLDTDQSGSVNFTEFLVWYFQQFGAPSASDIARSKKMMKEEQALLGEEAEDASGAIQKAGEVLSGGNAGTMGGRIAPVGKDNFLSIQKRRSKIV